MKKKLVSVVLMLVMCIALVGCDSEETTTASTSGDGAAEVDASDIEVGVIFKSLSAQYWKDMKSGAEDAAAELGIGVTVLGPSDESEISQQVTMIEEQIAAGVNAIAVAPCEENAVIGALDPYTDSIPVLIIDTDANLEGKKAFIGTGNENAAKLAGDYAAEELGEGAKAVLIGGQQGENTSTQRLAGFRKGLEEGGVEVLEEQFGKNTADQAVAVMEDLITKYPGEIDVVLCMNDDMAVGCQTAIEQAGEDIMIIGFNGDETCAEMIKEGKIDATVAQQPYLMGYQTVEQAYKAAMGEEIETEQDIPASLITIDNVDAYLNGEN